MVRAVAAQGNASDCPAQLVGCWVNAGWSQGLSVHSSRGWEDRVPAGEGTDTGGLVSVLIARRHRWDKVSVCGYLADVYCLGIKNVLGPDIMDELALRQFVPTYYAAYSTGWQDAPIELAQHLVFGAVDYAHSLGFEPATGFAEATGHLGAWQGPSDITFGKDGKPFYTCGPHDNPSKIIQTLERTVGAPPNFDYISVIGAHAAVW